MKLLLDTSLFIPLEPTSLTDLVREDPTVLALANAAHLGGHTMYVHPATLTDLERNGDIERRELRRLLLAKYPELPTPPPPTTELADCFGNPEQGSNDWVDMQLVAAVDGDAVDYLVSDDGRMRRLAADAGMGDRTFSTAEALELMHGLSAATPEPPPAVIACVAHALDPGDPIFDSLRDDYPEFDAWFSKCRLEHRQSWVIEALGGNAHGAVAIAKDEPDNPAYPGERVLKACTFKVSGTASGMYYGELLLRALLNYAHTNGFDVVYMTAFEKHVSLLRFLGDFGFETQGRRTDRGELELAKRMSPAPTPDPELAPLAYHVRYGPYHWTAQGVGVWVVPIRPPYHQTLFPDAEAQLALVAGDRPPGNSIRKAYLSNAGRRDIQPGDLVLFYKSRDGIITALGVAEDTLLSRSPDEVARFVSRRTVYPLGQIEEMCARPRGVLAIIFRYAYALTTPITLAELKQNGLLTTAPQSIQRLRKGNTGWLQDQLTHQ